MSFFGKIKSAVMGNPVTRDYEVGKQIASAGPGLMWKVHQAIKKSNRQACSVFLFSKQTPDFEKLHKREREQILEMLRKGPTQLVRLKHPRLLTIDHPLEESNNCLAFATESVSIGLANILGTYDNLPSPLPLRIKEYDIHPIEIQYGLYNISEGLEFLHSGVRLMHGNVTPEVVVVTDGGTWKLVGFNFSCYSQYQSETTTAFEFQEWDHRRPLHTNPSLDFLAPEYILSKSCNEKSDIYSFGMLCYAVYNGGRPLCSSLNNILSFKQNVETISRVSESGLGETPYGMRSLVRNMLAVEPSVRPDATEISKHPFFEEVGVATLRYLDTLYEKGDMERSQYFKKNLAMIITKLPKRIVHQRVLPALKEEFRNHKMVPFVLPIMLLVAEDCTMQEYGDVIMPVLIPALKIQDPIQVPLILLQKMDLLLNKTSPDDIRQHILPTIITSLESTNPQLQEVCISLIPSFATTVDYSSMKHSIIPRLTALMITAESLSLRVKCLVAVAKMLDSLDKHIVHDHILPLLPQIPTREPGVLLAILGIYHSVLKNKKIGMDKVLLATKVLPFLLPITIEPTLNLAQFNQFILVIRDMLQSVETEQQTHLEQLSKMEEQTKSTVQFARDVSEAKAMEDTITKFEETFGTGSHDSHMIPKRGSNIPSTTSGSSTTKPPQNSGDMFAGIFPSPQLPSQPSTTTHTSHITPSIPSPSSHTSLNLSTTPSQPTPQTTAIAQPMVTMTTMQQQPLMSNNGMGMGLSNMGMEPQQTGSGMGMTPNLLGGSRSSQNEPSNSISFQTQPNRSTSSGYVLPAVSRGGSGMGISSGTGMGIGSGGGTGIGIRKSGGTSVGMGSTSGGGMGMGSTSGAGMGMGNVGGSGMGMGSGRGVSGIGLGSGGGGISMGNKSSGDMSMGIGSGGSTGLGSGMSGIGTWNGSSGMSSGDTGLFSGMQVHSNSQAAQGSHMTGTTNQIGAMGQTNQMSEQSQMMRNPIGAQLHGNTAPLIATETRSAGGWSSSINSGHSTAQNISNPAMGWSSGIPGAVQSSNLMSQNPSSLMTPMQPSVAQSTNWSMPQTQQIPAQSANWMPQNQAPTAASLMMGGAPLLHQGTATKQQPPQISSDNPFADLSFLG